MPPRTAVDAEAAEAVVVEDVAATAAEAVDTAEDGMETVAEAEEAKAEVETALRARTKEKEETRSVAAIGAENAAAEDKAANRVEANPKVDHGRVR